MYFYIFFSVFSSLLKRGGSQNIFRLLAIGFSFDLVEAI